METLIKATFKVFKNTYFLFVQKYFLYFKNKNHYNIGQYFNKNNYLY